MSHARMSLFAAACLAPLATSAMAQTVEFDVGRAPGCGRCGVSFSTEGPVALPPVAPGLNPGISLGATALAPDTGAASAPPAEKSKKKPRHAGLHHRNAPHS
jgi:hypothetical protein